MIVVNTQNEKKEFGNLVEFYKWLLINKSVDELVINDKDAMDLYSFFKFYFEVKKKCELELNKINKEFISENDNKLVKKAINELIRMNSDGKFLRASLIALGYLSANKNDDYYLPLAAAYETFQTAILIHDDIIDNATIRRGKNTIPKVYNDELETISDNSSSFKIKKEHLSNSLGVCIGDLGFYFANKIILDNYNNSPKLSNILSLYNKIVINTIKGEIIDVLLPFKEEYEKNISLEEDVMEIYKLKTAWYTIIGPYELGMAFSDFSEEQIKKIEGILYNLGVAFQIKDDILGIFGNEVELGKSASSDISEFKQTILYTYVSKNNKEKLKELHKYYGKSELTKENLDSVKEIFITTGALEYSNNMMNKLFVESKEKLETIDFIEEDKKSVLRGFITYLNLRNK